jgi:hypothetical protein
MKMPKPVTKILVLLGLIFFTIIIAIPILYCVLLINDTKNKKIKIEVENGNTSYISKHINNIDIAKINYYSIIDNNKVDAIKMLIAGDKIPEEIKESYYKYSKEIINVFNEKYRVDNNGKIAKQNLEYIERYLGPDKIDAYQINGGYVDYNNVLLKSSKYGNTKLVEYMIENKHCNINFADNDGLTSVLYSIRNNNRHEESYPNSKILTFLYLIKNGGDIFHKTKDGKTAIIYAYESNIFVVKYLLEKGMDINYSDNMGNTIMHYYYMDPEEGGYHDTAMEEYLIKSDADLQMKNKAGKTPIDIRNEILK